MEVLTQTYLRFLECWLGLFELCFVSDLMSWLGAHVDSDLSWTLPHVDKNWEQQWLICFLSVWTEDFKASGPWTLSRFTLSSWCVCECRQRWRHVDHNHQLPHRDCEEELGADGCRWEPMGANGGLTVVGPTVFEKVLWWFPTSPTMPQWSGVYLMRWRASAVFFLWRVVECLKESFLWPGCDPDRRVCSDGLMLTVQEHCASVLPLPQLSEWIYNGSTLCCSSAIWTSSVLFVSGLVGEVLQEWFPVPLASGANPPC